jgi:hypothetical protein
MYIRRIYNVQGRCEWSNYRLSVVHVIMRRSCIASDQQYGHATIIILLLVHTNAHYSAYSVNLHCTGYSCNVGSDYVSGVCNVSIMHAMGPDEGGQGYPQLDIVHHCLQAWKSKGSNNLNIQCGNITEQIDVTVYWRALVLAHYSPPPCETTPTLHLQPTPVTPTPTTPISVYHARFFEYES